MKKSNIKFPRHEQDWSKTKPYFTYNGKRIKFDTHRLLRRRGISNDQLILVNRGGTRRNPLTKVYIYFTLK